MSDVIRVGFTYTNHSGYATYDEMTFYDSTEEEIIKYCLRENKESEHFKVIKITIETTKQISEGSYITTTTVLKGLKTKIEQILELENTVTKLETSIFNTKIKIQQGEEWLENIDKEIFLRRNTVESLKTDVFLMKKELEQFKAERDSKEYSK